MPRTNSKKVGGKFIGGTSGKAAPAIGDFGLPDLFAADSEVDQKVNAAQAASARADSIESALIEKFNGPVILRVRDGDVPGLPEGALGYNIPAREAIMPKKK